MRSKWDREELLRRYLAGETYQDLADEFNVTRERIRQIMGATREQVAVASAARTRVAQDFLMRYGNDIRDRAVIGMGHVDIAKELEIPHDFVRLYIRQHLSEEEKASRKQITAERVSRANRRFSSEDMVAAIKEVSVKLCVNSLASAMYEAHRDHDRHPSRVTITQSIGWNVACQRAGLAVNGVGANGWGDRSFTDEQLYAALDRITNVLGHIPSVYEYSKMCREDEPTYGAIQARISRTYGNGQNSWLVVRRVMQERLTK